MPCYKLPADSDNDTRHPVPKLPNEIRNSVSNLYVNQIHDFKRKVPNNLLHGSNITCQPLDISSDWEPVETFDNITDAVPHVTENLATSTSMPVLKQSPVSG